MGNYNITIVSDICQCSFIEWYDTIKFLDTPMRFDCVALNLLEGRNNFFDDNGMPMEFLNTLCQNK